MSLIDITSEEALRELIQHQEIALKRARELQMSLRIESEVSSIMPPPGTTTYVIPKPHLKVPWKSQLSDDASYAAGDCGPACLAMCLEYFGFQNITVDRVARATELAKGFRFTTVSHLQQASSHWNIPLLWWPNASIKLVQDELRAGRPVVALVYYPDLLIRSDPDYPWSHWIVITRVTGQKVLYLDPYWEPGVNPNDDKATREIEIPLPVFLQAWGDNHLSGNEHSDNAIIAFNVPDHFKADGD